MKECRKHHLPNLNDCDACQAWVASIAYNKRQKTTRHSEHIVPHHTDESGQKNHDEKHRSCAQLLVQAELGVQATRSVESQKSDDSVDQYLRKAEIDTDESSFASERKGDDGDDSSFSSEEKNDDDPGSVATAVKEASTSNTALPTLDDAGLKEPEANDSKASGSKTIPDNCVDLSCTDVEQQNAITKKELEIRKTVFTESQISDGKDIMNEEQYESMVKELRAFAKEEGLAEPKFLLNSKEVKKIQDSHVTLGHPGMGRNRDHTRATEMMFDYLKQRPHREGMKQTSIGRNTKKEDKFSPFETWMRKEKERYGIQEDIVFLRKKYSLSERSQETEEWPENKIEPGTEGIYFWSDPKHPEFGIATRLALVTHRFDIQRQISDQAPGQTIAQEPPTEALARTSPIETNDESSFGGDGSTMEMEDEGKQPILEDEDKRSSNTDFKENSRSTADGGASLHENNGNHCIEVETNYGRHEDERKMRAWLDVHQLPQSTADILLELGARCVDDVLMLVQEMPEHLSNFRPLDLLKLNRAVTQRMMGSP